MPNMMRRRLIQYSFGASLMGITANMSAPMQSMAASFTKKSENSLPVGEPKNFDFIVVGGGSAGAVMAARLSENSNKTVFLIEAGECYAPDNYPEKLALAKNVGGDDESTWAPIREINSPKPSGIIRAKVLGGGSAINAAGFIRAPESDFKRWQRGGLTGWSFSEVLPFFKKSEASDFGDDQWHGRNGPLPVHLRKRTELSKSGQDFIDSAIDAGITYIDDINVPFPKGVGVYPLNIKGEQRINTGIAYLNDEVRSRPNLHIRGNTLVDKILVKDKQAWGVQLATGETIAAKEIILSAGAIGSPAILLRSGIGPESDLREQGIPLVANLPVGKFLMDQPHIYVQISTKNDGGLFPPIGGNIGAQSPLATQDELDIYLGFNNFADLTLSPTGSAFGIIVCACRPSSRGELKLASPDPFISPLVSLNLLSDNTDAERLIAGLGIVSKLLGHEPLKSGAITATFSDGTPIPTSHKELKPLLRKYVRSTLHYTSSVPMGPISKSSTVLDEKARVRGIGGLRVVDASIFPDVPSVATNATVIMAAEYLSDQIQAESN